MLTIETTYGCVNLKDYQCLVKDKVKSQEDKIPYAEYKCDYFKFVVSTGFSGRVRVATAEGDLLLKEDLSDKSGPLTCEARLFSREVIRIFGQGDVWVNIVRVE